MYNDMGRAFGLAIILYGILLVAGLIALPFAVGALWRAWRRWRWK